MTAATRGGPAAILWDFDGTLMDTETVWHDIELGFAAERGAVLPPDFQQRTVGGTMAATAAYLKEMTGTDEGLDDIAATLWRHCMDALAVGPIPWLPGARELVAECTAAGVRQALVSTSKRNYLDVILTRLDPCPFEVIVSGDDVRRHKPHPEPYLHACALLGVDPHEVLVVEDSNTGVASAVAAGAAVVGVPSVHPLEPAEGLSIVASLAGMRLGDLRALAH